VDSVPYNIHATNWPGLHKSWMPGYLGKFCNMAPNIVSRIISFSWHYIQWVCLSSHTPSRKCQM